MELMLRILLAASHGKWSVNHAMQVHCVKSADKIHMVLMRHSPLTAPVILHSFAGPPDMVAPFAQIPVGW